MVCLVGTVSKLGLLAALAVLAFGTEPAKAFDLAGTAWAASAEARSLDPRLLYAVALVEAGRPTGDGIAPHPWPFNIGGVGPRFARNREEAVAILRAHAGQGLIDVCPMQINLRWHRHRVADVEELLDAERCIELGAAILREAIDSLPHDLTMGVGRYHSRDAGRARAYGGLVLRVYANLLSLGETQR